MRWFFVFWQILSYLVHQIFNWIDKNPGATGLIVAGIQIWLAWWAVIKPLNQSRIDRDNSVLNLLKSELKYNLSTIEKNLVIIDAELKEIDRMHTIVQPLSEFKNASFMYFYSNVPDSISRDKELFLSIQAIIHALETVNGLIRSQQMFKIQNGGNPLAFDTLKKLDGIIHDDMKVLQRHLIELEKKQKTIT